MTSANGAGRLPRPRPLADPPQPIMMRRSFATAIAVCCAVLPAQAVAAVQDPIPVEDAPGRAVAPSPVLLPASFQSDGCTWWFDGDHKACCVQHDIDNALAQSWRDRRRADRRLCACIWRTPGWWHKPMAPVMWTGVQVLHRGIRPLLGVLHLRRSAQ